MLTRSVFVISPDSARSDICQWEVDESAPSPAQGKQGSQQPPIEVAITTLHVDLGREHVATAWRARAARAAIARLRHPPGSVVRPSLPLLVEHDGLSAAILDHALDDGNSSLLYARLKERGIPFVIYSGLKEG